jgi:hypothetical protein
VAGIIGGTKKNATTPTKFTQMDVRTSAQGLPIPIVWGKNVVAGNLIDAGNFVATAVKQGGGKKSSGGGGKGGVGSKGGGGVSGYTYSADLIIGLCEGPIQEIDRVFVNQQALTFPVSDGTVPDTLFLGTAEQVAWPHLTGDPYAYTAYVAGADVDFGSTPAAPAFRWEVVGLFSGTMPLYPDANPADIINDALVNFQYGVGFGPGVGVAGSFINQESWELYKLYTQAQTLLLSPALVTQEETGQFIKRIADVTNSWIFWSGGELKFVPLGDAFVTDGTVSYFPDNTTSFDLNYDHFIRESGAPVSETIISPADRPNTVKMEVRYRAAFYEAFPVEWKDQALADEFGEVHAPVAPGQDICEPDIGAIIVRLIGQRAANISRLFKFKLGWEFFWLEPGDKVTITDPHLGLSLYPVRIRTLDEDDRGYWSVVAEEFPAGLVDGTGTGNATGTQPTQAGVTTSFINQFVDPGSVNPPVILEPQTAFAGGTPKLWIGASGGLSWGGADVHVSFDNVNYDFIGPVLSPTRQGSLVFALPSHADPDNDNTLTVDLGISFGSFTGNATHADADAGRTLSYVTAPYTTVVPNTGELIAYGTSVMVGPYSFALSYLRRGRLGTAPAAHAIGDKFARIDFSGAAGALSPNLLVYDLPVAYIGVPLYFKFVSFNQFGGGKQDISLLPAYIYTPGGAGFGTSTGGVPAAPTGLVATPGIGSVTLSWAANPAADNVTGYKVYRAAGLSQPFGSATLLATLGPTLTYANTGLAASSTWTYFLKATNVIGDSTQTAGVNATVLTAALNAWYQSMSVGNKLTDLGSSPWDGNFEIFDVEMPTSVSFPVNFSTSPTPGCKVAPVSTVTLTFQTITGATPTTVGTLTITGGSTTGTFSLASPLTVPAGDRLRLYAPAAVDTTISGLFGTLVGTR